MMHDAFEGPSLAAEMEPFDIMDLASFLEYASLRLVIRNRSIFTQLQICDQGNTMLGNPAQVRPFAPLDVSFP